ncbi:acyl-CoA dehydrogenase [Paenibacillus sp. J31TS4]|uniref:acyl-CoA dehydrogenase family protein n=1 Tax=Paenibacillus sp. J31TS4 TaxID=2807195 RepID=UPI001B08D0F8|nr:acyl-CoA dehydrogenase family protein [Paenibacillus sp. J31TS4]GIP41044.1 acyl-CoA dehydrogenase [Paenibacillus sp. J31TS4]
MWGWEEGIRERLREQADRIEQAGELPVWVLDWLYKERLFKLFVPEELGGRMAPLPEAFRVFEEVSRADGNAGWLVTIGAGGGVFAPAMTPETAREVFERREAVIAGSGMPTGTAVPVEGGYQVSGRWKYCSGAPYATTFTANCVIDRGEGVPAGEIRSFAFRPEQVTIREDWASFGLKATGSHTIEVTDQFVPEERTFDLTAPPAPGTDPLYRYPFLPFAQGSFAAVGLGIARHYLEEAGRFVERSRDGWEAAKPGRADRTAEAIREAEALLDAAARVYYEAVERTWERVVEAGALTDEEQSEVSAACKAMGRTARETAQAVFPKLGMAALMEGTALNRTWRDLHTACQHSLLAE